MREVMGWDPFAEMFGRESARSYGEERTFAPGFEVKETKDSYFFSADLPGVEEKDLDISLTGNRLTVSGRREEEKRDESDRYYAYERTYGTFNRTFTLPEDANVDHVTAELKSGVLTISIPKHAELQPKKVSLKGVAGNVAEKVKGALGGKEKGEAKA